MEASRRPLGDVLEAPRAVLEAFGGSWGPSGRSGDRLGGVLGARGAALEAYKSRLGRFPGRHGAVLGALRSMLEPYGELPRRFWTRPDGSGQRLADLLISIVFCLRMFIVFR